jgi:hypothetical protein
MHRWLVLVVAVAACYQSGDPPDGPPSCEIACDFAGAGSLPACPPEMTCVGEPFLEGKCVSSDVVACGSAASPFAGLPFGDPVPLLMQAIEEDDPSLTGDLLELFILTSPNLLVATRENLIEPFSTPVVVAELDDPLTQLRPCVSTDGLTILFARRLLGPPIHDDIFISTRASRSAPWEAPMPLPGDINTTSNELPAWLSPDGLTLVFEADVDGGTNDLIVARRSAPGAEFVRGEALSAINSPENDGRGGFDATGTSFVFESDRGGAIAIWEGVFVGGSWSVIPHPELDSSQAEGTPWLSPDGRTVVFSSNREGTGSDDDLFVATR